MTVDEIFDDIVSNAESNNAETPVVEESVIDTNLPKETDLNETTEDISQIKESVLSDEIQNMYMTMETTEDNSESMIDNYLKSHNDVKEESYNEKLNRVFLTLMKEAHTRNEMKELLEEEYVFGDMTDKMYHDILSEMEALNKESCIGGMLPQVPVSKEKSNDEQEELVEEEDIIGELADDIVLYMLDPDTKYTSYTEGALTQLADKLKNKFKLSRNLKKLITKRSALKVKLKIATKKRSKIEKITSLKKDLIDTEKEIRELKKGLDKNAIKEINTLTSEMDKKMKESEEKFTKELKRKGFFKESQDDIVTEGVLSSFAITGGIIAICGLVGFKAIDDRNKFIKGYAKENGIPSKKDLKRTTYPVKPFSKTNEADTEHPVKGRNKFTQWIKETSVGSRVIEYTYQGKPFFQVAIDVQRNETDAWSHTRSDGVSGLSVKGAVGYADPFSGKAYSMRREIAYNFIHPLAKKHKYYYMCFGSCFDSEIAEDCTKFMKNWLKDHKKKNVKESVEVVYTDDIVKYQTLKESVTARLEVAQDEGELDNIRTYTNQLKAIGNKLLQLNEAEVIDIYPENPEILTEANNIDPEIGEIIAALNAKGYKTKYSSAGHTQLRKKGDNKRDGVYHGNLYSDARVMFADDYDFPKAPKYWAWKNVDGKSYLDIIPLPYKKKDGNPSEAFNKWKSNYMGTLKTWVENLPDKSKTENSAIVKDTKGREQLLESVDEMYENMKMNLETELAFLED